MEQNYTPDILGSGFEQLQLSFFPDYEGEVICTLIRKQCLEASTSAVLYIHGFNDYFFQEELAAQFIKQGFNFYAVDLRKCGRSILPHQQAYNLRSIDEYFADIDACLSTIKAEGNSKVVLLAHSTGGLTAALYLNSRGAACDALILNSPFLEMNKSWRIRKLGIPFVSLIAKFFPDIKIQSNFSPFYGQSLHANEKGEWQYRLDWKPIKCDLVTSGWLRGIYKAHNIIKKGLNISCPVLVMSSNRSIKGREWSNAYLNSDGVLNVDHIQKYADKLGDNVSKLQVENGLHDLFLSTKAVRESAYSSMFSWLASVLPNCT